MKGFRLPSSRAEPAGSRAWPSAGGPARCGAATMVGPKPMLPVARVADRRVCRPGLRGPEGGGGGAARRRRRPVAVDQASRRPLGRPRGCRAEETRYQQWTPSREVLHTIASCCVGRTGTKARPRRATDEGGTGVGRGGGRPLPPPRCGPSRVSRRKRSEWRQRLQNLIRAGASVRVPVPDLQLGAPPTSSPPRSRPSPGTPRRYRARPRKLTPAQVAAIRAVAGVRSLRALAADFGVSQETVRPVLRECQAVVAARGAAGPR